MFRKSCLLAFLVQDRQLKNGSFDCLPPGSRLQTPQTHAWHLEKWEQSRLHTSSRPLRIILDVVSIDLDWSIFFYEEIVHCTTLRHKILVLPPFSGFMASSHKRQPKQTTTYNNMKHHGAAIRRCKLGLGVWESTISPPGSTSKRKNSIIQPLFWMHSETVVYSLQRHQSVPAR